MIKLEFVAANKKIFALKFKKIALKTFSVCLRTIKTHISTFITPPGPTHPYGWRTAGHSSHLSQVESPLRGGGGAEAGVQGEEGTCATPEGVQVGAGSPGLRAQLHYYGMTPVAAHPQGNQRLSGLMGWGAPGQEAGGEC